MKLLLIDKYKYNAMIGVGGVGSGIFFALNGNHTLGREESRSGHILNRKDYCKLHIVSHYVKTLLGSAFNVIPIGKVGDDEAGRALFEEMKEAGLHMKYIWMCKNEKTLFSFCLVYPDGSGGNLTIDNSASSKVSPEDIEKAEEAFELFGERAIGVAVPEVPLESRIALLKLATKYRLYRIASFTSSEMEKVREKALLKIIDHLALNIDEASRFTGLHECDDVEKIVHKASELFRREYPGLSLSITAGKMGNWIWDTKKLHYFKAPEVTVRSTAGSGDAFLAGFIAGITAGLELSEAQELATLVAAQSVTSPHTINKDIERESLLSLLKKTGYSASNAVKKILE